MAQVTFKHELTFPSTLTWQSQLRMVVRTPFKTPFTKLHRLLLASSPLNLPPSLCRPHSSHMIAWRVIYCLAPSLLLPLSGMAFSGRNISIDSRRLQSWKHCNAEFCETTGPRLCHPRFSTSLSADASLRNLETVLCSSRSFRLYPNEIQYCAK